MPNKLISILTGITEPFNAASDVNTAKHIFEEAVMNSEIKQIDKMKMVLNIRRCRTKVAAQQLFYNSLLRFEGLSVNKQTAS